MLTKPSPRGRPPIIPTKTLCGTHRRYLASSRVISGCSRAPRVWTKSHNPWFPLAGPCGASGAADARERAKLAQNLVKFQNLRSRSAYQRTQCFRSYGGAERTIFVSHVSSPTRASAVCNNNNITRTRL